MEKNNLQNKILHSLFEITILVKGINGIWEIIMGVLFFFFKEETIYKAIIAVTGYRIIRYSGHFTTNYLIRQANNFSANTKYFIAFYFLFYGIVNIFLVIFLSRGKLWAFPVTILFFSFFIVYQFYRFFLHHSGLLLFFSIFDIFLVFLTWLEYKRLKNLKTEITLLHINNESNIIIK